MAPSIERWPSIAKEAPRWKPTQYFNVSGENSSWKCLLKISMFLEIKQKLLLVHFHCSFLLNQPFCTCYVSLIRKNNRFSLVDKHKKYALLRHKTTLEVSTWLYKQRWSSTRQNILFETFEVTIYAILDTRRKKGAQFSSKNRSSWISRLQKLGME